MQTDKIRVTGNGGGAKQALDEASKFAAYVGLDNKSALRLRLLAEETLGMIAAITDEFTAEFWIESTKDKICKIHLTARTVMDYVKKQELIKASSDQKNAAAKGFMGKIRQIIENSLYSIDEVGSLQSEYGGAPLMFGEMGMCEPDSAGMMSSATYLWSLEKYKNSVSSRSGSDKAAKEAWDELEKSIVANIADNVSVAVKGDVVELIFEKKF